MSFRVQMIEIFVLPFIRHELPGWGKIYNFFIGAYQKDYRWQNQPPVIVRGKLHHYDMELDIGGWSNRATWALGRFYDLGTQLIIGKLLSPGDLFVDVGANEGMISLVASRAVGGDGHVIAFEPNPTPRAKFQRNLELNRITNVTIIAKGASDSSDSLELFVPTINTGEGSFARDAHDHRPGVLVTCPVVAADTELVNLNPVVIKIDVEGFEPKVIDGLRATIARSQPVILMEMVQTHLIRANSTPQMVCDSMERLGYVGMQIAIHGLIKKRLYLKPIHQSEWRDADVIWLPHNKAPHLIQKLASTNDWDIKKKQLYG